MNNKRGQGLSTSAIVLIVLAVVVLVILIIGFTMGWSSIAPWLSSSNVDTIVSSCEVACSTASTYEFCNVDRELKDAEGTKVLATCFVFHFRSVSLRETLLRGRSLTISVT